MCGIVGVVAFTGGDPSEVLEGLLGKIRHRGVSWCQSEMQRWENVALGTNRLPIESLNTSTQPRTSYSKQLHAVYNGEIYNWRTLLTDSNRRFKNSAEIDESQVVIDYLAARGELALTDFDGMYAFIAYDSVAKKLMVARDPLGIKPLYFANDGNNLYVASELKALVGINKVTEVREVKPGYFYKVCTRSKSASPKLDAKRFWSYPVGLNEPVSLSELRKELTDAVTSCVATNKEVAVHLSGGVDSTAVLALALLKKRNIHVINIGKSDAPDTIASRALADEFGFNLLAEEVPNEDELFERVFEIIKITESFEPNVIRQSSVHYYLARAAKDAGAMVVLCGEGADELFGGYPEFLSVDRDNFFMMRKKFINDLHRTQLQRVDRVSMHFSLETRVPFLRNGPVNMALSSTYLPSFIDPQQGLAGTKTCLRDSLKDVVPDRWRLRPKAVLSEGAGLGGNDPLQGMFSKIVSKAITSSEVKEIQHTFSDWKIRTAEEAFYFREFDRLGYTKLLSAKNRVFVNRVNSCEPDFFLS